ncbi:MAG: nucleotidyl transferase AbiEii/AbiGii toxin family protein, partial [Candidatus Omnitrophota bacterium]|nr:nucleotidyl transferase AbiEii/AbiGii toxin family protein [Candidatus Omnitrophota bacterium]
KIDDFYLAGGTALSMFYYEHRESFDLDFFTKQFSKGHISKIIDNLKKDSNWSIELVAEQNTQNLARVAVYLAKMEENKECKIDFVEDYIPLFNPLKRVDGINILSLEDIYLRKIYAVAGHIPAFNDIGQSVILGGRQTAKDFYDLYCLSTITMPLSKFVSNYCEDIIKEGIVRWYRTYDRMTIMEELLILPTRTKPDYRVIENHFKKEIDRLLEILIGGE